MMNLVYLKDGKRSKAQYNGWKARVGRRQSGWAKVTLLDNGRSLKWRNKAWTAAEPEPKQQSQSSLSLESLPDGVLSHTLTFLDGCVAVDAAIALAATCSSLRHRMRETVGPSMQVKANLLHLRPIPQYIMLLKLSVARINLEELHVNVGSADMHLLSSLIENEFLKCRNLIKFGAKTARLFNSNYLFPSLALNDHLLNYPMSRHLIEVSERGRSFTWDTESLNTVVSRQCRKLKSLRFFMCVGTDELTTVDRSLSELPNLEQITVTLVDFSDSFHNAVKKLNILVTSIPNLKDLKVCSSYCGQSLPPSAFFRLESDTLETIDVVDIGKLVFFESIVCPKLRVFRCQGQGYGNGVCPWHPRRFHKNQQFFTDSSQSSRYTVAEQSFYGMQVPDDCVVEFENR
jgi:hypothetical protein